MAKTRSLRDKVFDIVMARVDQDEARRAEALREWMIVMMPSVSGDQAGRLAEMVPPLLRDLYAKWVGMFADRLAETVPADQLELLTNGDEDNAAALALAYVMFLESARMEEQIEEDLAEFGKTGGGDDELADAAAQYIRSRVAQVAKEAQVDKLAKAREYQEKKKSH